MYSESTEHTHKYHTGTRDLRHTTTLKHSFTLVCICKNEREGYRGMQFHRECIYRLSCFIYRMPNLILF